MTKAELAKLLQPVFEAARCDLHAVGDEPPQPVTQLRIRMNGADDVTVEWWC